jgi:hypothetical protein
LELRGRKWEEAGEDYIIRSFITCTLDQILLEVIKSRRMRWAGHVAHEGNEKEIYIYICIYKILV